MSPKLIKLVFVIAFLIRILFATLSGWQKVSFQDGKDYIETSKYLCQNHTYPDRGSLPFFRAPGLPIFCALVTFCNPERIYIIKFFLIILDLFSIYFIFKLSHLFFKNIFISYLTSICASLYPFFIFQAIDIRSEPLLMFFLTGSLFFIFNGLSYDKTLSIFFSGIFVSLSSLTRPECLFIFVYFVFILILLKKIKFLILYFLSFLIFLSPWIIRNYITYKEIIIVNDSFGYNLWRGSLKEIYKIRKTKDKKEFKEAQIYFEQIYSKKIEEEIEKKANKPMKKNKEWLKLAYENIKNDPKFYIYYTFFKTFDFIRPYLLPQEYGFKKFIISFFIFILLYIFSFIGFLSYKENKKFLWIIIGYLIISWFIHIPFQVVIRFRIPFIDPILLIFFSSELLKGINFFYK